MKNKFKKILSIFALASILGFLGIKTFEKAKISQKQSKNIGFNDENSENRIAQNDGCTQKEDENDDVLYMGCNGIF